MKALILLLSFLLLAAGKPPRKKTKLKSKAVPVITQAPVKEKGLAVLLDTYENIDGRYYNMQRQLLEYSKTDVDTFVTFSDKSDTLVFNCRQGARRLMHAHVTSSTVRLAGDVRTGMARDSVRARLPLKPQENRDTLILADALSASRAVFIFKDGRLAIFKYDYRD